MPARPAYFHRLREAIPEFARVESAWIDRRTVEEILGVSKTVAWRILRQCGAAEGPGNTLVAPREAFAAALEALAEGGACRQEVARRNRLEAYLEDIARFGRSRRTRVATGSSANQILSSRLSSLPPGVNLQRSRLSVEFCGTEDFLAKVGAVVFAVQNDYDALSRFIEGA